MTDDAEPPSLFAAPPTLFKDKLKAWASSLSPLIVALVVVCGLSILSAENLSGSSRVRSQGEHSEAIFKLLFRN